MTHDEVMTHRHFQAGPRGVAAARGWVADHVGGPERTDAQVLDLVAERYRSRTGDRGITGFYRDFYDRADLAHEEPDHEIDPDWDGFGR